MDGPALASATCSEDCWYQAPIDCRNAQGPRTAPIFEGVAPGPGVSVSGVAITPDTKNWTWVLERPCPECGFDADSFATRGRRPDHSRQRRARGSGSSPRADVRTRPRADVWSPLEYGCHVRDVYRICDGRLDLMLREDDPTFANWDQDETALDDAYDDAGSGDGRGRARGRGRDRIADRFDGVDRRRSGRARAAAATARTSRSSRSPATSCTTSRITSSTSEPVDVRV